MNIKNLTARISRTTKNFATKTHGEAFHINASNWGKTGGFNMTFNPIWHGLFWTIFAQSQKSTPDGPIFKICFCLKDFEKFYDKIVERTS